LGLVRRREQWGDWRERQVVWSHGLHLSSFEGAAAAAAAGLSPAVATAAGAGVRRAGGRRKERGQDFLEKEEERTGSSLEGKKAKQEESCRERERIELQGNRRETGGRLEGARRELRRETGGCGKSVS